MLVSTCLINISPWVGYSPHFEKCWTRLWSPNSCVGTLGWCPWCVNRGLRAGLPTGVRQTLALSILNILLQFTSPAFLAEAVPPLSFSLTSPRLHCLLCSLWYVKPQAYLHLKALTLSWSYCSELLPPGPSLFQLCLIIRKTFPGPPPLNGSLPPFSALFFLFTLTTT